MIFTPVIYSGSAEWNGFSNISQLHTCPEWLKPCAFINIMGSGTGAVTDDSKHLDTRSLTLAKAGSSRNEINKQSPRSYLILKKKPDLVNNRRIQLPCLCHCLSKHLSPEATHSHRDPSIKGSWAPLREGGNQHHFVQWNLPPSLLQRNVWPFYACLYNYVLEQGKHSTLF